MDTNLESRFNEGFRAGALEIVPHTLVAAPALLSGNIPLSRDQYNAVRDSYNIHRGSPNFLKGKVAGITVIIAAYTGITLAIYELSQTLF